MIISPSSQYGLTWWEKASPAMGTLRVSVTTGVGVWKCAFVTVNTHCAQIQRQKKQEKKKVKGLKKEVKKTPVGVAAIEAEMHTVEVRSEARRKLRDCLPKRTAWKALKRCLSQGAPLHTSLLDEQVENKAESSWHDLAKQKRKPGTSLSLVKRGWEDRRAARTGLNSWHLEL